MDKKWKDEMMTFANLDSVAQVQWISHLMFEVSMLARGTYDIDSDGVDDPPTLRIMNELLHRVAEHQCQILRERVYGSTIRRTPDDIFFERLELQLGEARINKRQLLKSLRRRLNWAPGIV